MARIFETTNQNFVCNMSANQMGRIFETSQSAVSVHISQSDIGKISNEPISSQYEIDQPIR